MSTPCTSEAVCILGLPIDLVSMAQAVARVHEAALTRKKCIISTPNLNFLINARRDAAFRESVLRSDLSLADGVSLLAVARMMGVRLPERVSGADLFLSLCEANHAPPLRVFFLGGPKDAARLACEKMNHSAKGAIGVGYDEAGFGDVESLSPQSLIDKINACHADFLVVSLGAAKGQAWIMRNHARLNTPVISHLGAVVNFTAGTVRRAPMWMQKAGLEWLWRASTEAGLFRRYWEDGKALLNILVTKHLTGALLERQHRHDTHVKARAETLPSSDPAKQLMKLSGHWGRDDLLTLRAALRANPSATSIEIEGSEVAWLDPYALGQLTKRHGELLSNGGLGVSIRHLPKVVEQQMQRHEVQYLLS